MRKAGFFVAAVLFVAGIVFVVFPIGAIPDETLVAVGAAIAGLVGGFQELRAWLQQRNATREHDGVVASYEEKLRTLASGAPERLREALEGLQQATRAALREHMSSMQWTAFERLVGTVLERLGFSNVVVTQSTRDHGVDVRASYAAANVAPIDFCVQAKRTDTVGAPDVQKLRGACTKGEHAILVTSGRFTPDAVHEAAQLPRVTLISGERLADLMIDLGLGVRGENVTIHEPELGSLPAGLQSVVEPETSTTTEVV